MKDIYTNVTDSQQERNVYSFAFESLQLTERVPVNDYYLSFLFSGPREHDSGPDRGVTEPHHPIPDHPSTTTSTTPTTYRHGVPRRNSSGWGRKVKDEVEVYGTVNSES